MRSRGPALLGMMLATPPRGSAGPATTQSPADQNEGWWSIGACVSGANAEEALNKPQASTGSLPTGKGVGEDGEGGNHGGGQDTWGAIST